VLVVVWHHVLWGSNRTMLGIGKCVISQFLHHYLQLRICL